MARTARRYYVPRGGWHLLAGRWGISAAIRKLVLVVATYRRPDAMRTLLASLERQTLARESFEVRVVVDGRDEHESAYRALFTEATQRGLPLVAVFQDNAGQSVARHRAILDSTAPWICVIDDDMDLVPGFLAAHLEALEAGGPRTVVIGRVVPEDGWEQQPLYEAVRTQAMLELHQGLARGTLRAQPSAFVTQNVSLSRAAYLEGGGFDEKLRLGEDLEMGVRLLQAGAHFVFVEGAAATHRSRVGAWSTWLSRQVAYGRSAVYIHEKHDHSADTHPLRNLVNGSRLNALAVRSLCWSDRLGRGGIAGLRSLGEGLKRVGLPLPAIATHKAILAIAYHLGVKEALGSWRAVREEARAFAARPDRPPDPT
jgi:GT2 family glycosyltransferase